MKMMLFILGILLVGCVPANEYVNILDGNDEYNEIKSNFASQFNRTPEFVMIENTLLTDEIIAQRLNELNNSPYSLLYKNLTSTKGLYLIKLQEKTEKNRGVIAVIDVSSKEVIKLYGTLDIELSKEVKNE